MSEFLGSIWWFLVAILVVVTFHEFGHFWVARRCGVKVNRFSIGFGKPLWSRFGKDGTEYAIAPILLGGYVSMHGERLDDDVSEAERAGSFRHKSVWQRIAIIAAGPGANLVLCVFMFWAMFVVGRPDHASVIGSSIGLAADTGLRPGDRLTAIDGRETPTWTEAYQALLTAAIDHKSVRLDVRSEGGVGRELRLDLTGLPDPVDPASLFRTIGMTPKHLIVPPVVSKVVAGQPAEGKLRPGDRIVAIDGTPVHTWNEIAPLAERMGRRGGGGTIDVVRDGQRVAIAIVPAQAIPKGAPANTPRSWIFGLEAPGGKRPPVAKDAILRHGPIEAIPAALGEVAFQTREFYGMLARAFTGRISARHTVSGPIGIAQFANESAKNGLAWYLQLLAVLSLSLALLNLLPIPILDGGHLLYYLIELVKGRPLSEGAMAVGQFVGMALLLGLMGLAFHNDIQRLIQ